MDCIMTNYIVILGISMLFGMGIAYSINIKSPMKIAFLVLLIMVLLHLVIPEEGETFNNYKNKLKNTNTSCNFTKRVSDGDYRLVRDKASLAPYSDIHLNQTYSNYPELSQSQLNYKACTNYESGKQSCLIPNPIEIMKKILPISKSLLVSGIQSTDDFNSVIREDFNYYKDRIFS